MVRVLLVLFVILGAAWAVEPPPTTEEAESQGYDLWWKLWHPHHRHEVHEENGSRLDVAVKDGDAHALPRARDVFGETEIIQPSDIDHFDVGRLWRYADLIVVGRAQGWYSTEKTSFSLVSPLVSIKAVFKGEAQLADAKGLPQQVFVMGDQLSTYHDGLTRLDAARDYLLFLCEVGIQEREVRGYQSLPGPLYRIGGVWSGAIALTRRDGRPGWEDRSLFGGALGFQTLDRRFGHPPQHTCELIPEEVLAVTELLVAAKDPGLRALIATQTERDRAIIATLTAAETPPVALPADLAALTPAERQASTALCLWQAWWDAGANAAAGKALISRLRCRAFLLADIAPLLAAP